jgi:hypothetical protein
LPFLSSSVSAFNFSTSCYKLDRKRNEHEFCMRERKKESHHKGVIFGCLLAFFFSRWSLSTSCLGFFPALDDACWTEPRRRLWPEPACLNVYAWAAWGQAYMNTITVNF